MRRRPRPPLRPRRVEVDTVILPYLNRARLSYVARSFCQTGAPAGRRSETRRPLRGMPGQ